VAQAGQRPVQRHLFELAGQERGVGPAEREHACAAAGSAVRDEGEAEFRAGELAGLDEVQKTVSNRGWKSWLMPHVALGAEFKPNRPSRPSLAKPETQASHRRKWLDTSRPATPTSSVNMVQLVLWGLPVPTAPKPSWIL
jgi:hypothetical protein